MIIRMHLGILLREQKKFEEEPDRQEPLHPYVIQKMCGLAKNADLLSFKLVYGILLELVILAAFVRKNLLWTQRSKLKCTYYPMVRWCIHY